MGLTAFIGLQPSLCAMGSFAPQAVNIWTERDDNRLSRRMYMLAACGLAVWMICRWLLGELPIMFTNIVCFGPFCATLAGLRLWQQSESGSERNAGDRAA